MRPISSSELFRGRAGLLALAAILLLGGALRFTGLDRGWSDSTFSTRDTRRGEGAFHHFHPDEATLVDASLRFDDPLDPPLTAYGSVPFYVLRLGLWLAGSPAPDGLDAVGSDRQERALFALARALAAGASWLTLPLVYLIGCQVASRPAALLATLFAATAPLAIQQAHFYTVDNPFALLATGAIAALLAYRRRPSPARAVAAGLLIGLTVGTRLVGVLLLAPAAVAQIGCGRGGLGARVRQALSRRSLWLMAAVTAAGALLALPYLAVRPELVFAEGSTADFGRSLSIAGGQRLRIFTLEYLGTVPFLYHWTHLWPAGAGWPLTLALAGGLALALARPTWGTAVVSCWAAVYFAAIGGLHAKPIRYLLPLLPPLSVLAGDLCWRVVRARSRWRFPAALAAGFVAIWTAAYGVAFARIYTTPDARLQAARWLADRVPSGARVGYETGAFSMAGLIDPARYRKTPLNARILFDARGYTTCEAASALVTAPLGDLDYLALIDVNRYCQVTAARDLLPGAASFYRHLYAGRLGFARVGDFAVVPRLGPLQFSASGVEHSFTGFDHPRVLIFQRKPAGEYRADLEAWQAALAADQHCPDRAVALVATLVGTDSPAEMGAALARLRAQYPHVALAEVLKRAHDCGGPCPAATWDELAAHAPWPVALSLADLGLGDVAVEVLEAVARRTAPASEETANGFILIGSHLERRAQQQQARRALELANALRESKYSLNPLAHLAFRAGEYGLACQYWERSLALDSTQAGIHSNLGQTAARYLRDAPQALYHLRRAIALDPGLRPSLEGWIADLERLGTP